VLPTPMATNFSPNVAFSGRFLLLIAGMSGLLSEISVGIIAAGLLDLGKTISLSAQQTSFIVVAMLGRRRFS
jgi:hypothetical protein